MSVTRDWKEWRLLDMGGLDGFSIQTIYEAIAEAVGRGDVPNTLVLCHPARPYVCVGYHQEVWKEVEVDHCKKLGYDIVRRQAGGGTVYLDEWQQFYHIIVSQKDPSVPKDLSSFFERFLGPTVETYKQMGIDAAFKPVNDVVVGQKKISGNGAGSAGDATFLIGNLIIDIDPSTVVAAMKVPSEKFKDKLAKSMGEYMTSIKGELGKVPPREEVKALYVRTFERVIGIKLVPGTLAPVEKARFDELLTRTKSADWALAREKGHAQLIEMARSKCTKVGGGMMVCETTYKAAKLLRVTLLSKDEIIQEVLISGDMFMRPRTALDDIENGLVGTRLVASELESRISRMMKDKGVDMPGISAKDLADAIMDARKKVP